MQLVHYITTSRHMGKFACILHHQLDVQCHPFIRDVYDNVPVVPTTVLLANYVGEYLFC